jgi:ABC-type uncharacterized transport system permease subunit
MNIFRKFAIETVFAVIPIIIALVLTALLLLGVGKHPIEVVQQVWQGAFANTAAVAKAVNFLLPLLLVSIGLVVTFRAGLWNIGVEGQMMAGAIFASYAALWIPIPAELGWLLIFIEIVFAALGGMVAAAIVGVLKIRMGVNEIFGGVAFNALINVFSIYLISGPWQPSIGGSAQGTEPFPAHAWLAPLPGDFSVNLLMIMIVVAAFVAVMTALYSTRWGLNLKAVGKNAKSALLLGIPTGHTAMSAFLVGGALAGIAGAYRVLFTFHNLRPLASGGIGFLGLLVVLLVSNRLILVPLVSFIFAAILTGTTRLQITLQMDSSVAEVAQGMMVLVVILFQGVREVYFPAQPSDNSPPSPEPAEVQL